MKKILTLTVLASLFFTGIKAQCSFGSYPPSFTLNPGWTNGAWLAKKYTLANTATLTGLALNSAANSLIPFRMAIYSDNSNTPGNLISTSAQGTITLGSNLLSIPSSTVLPAGNYWIAAIYGGSGPTTAGPSSTPIYYFTGNLASAPANNASWLMGVNYDIDYWAVINVPSINIAGPASVCAGSPVTFSASGASTYTWNTGALTSSLALTPGANASYTVSGTSQQGCLNYAVTSISVIATPTLTIAGPASVCAGSSVTFSASGASTYTWNTGALTSSLTLTPSANTSYTVSGTSQQGCLNYAVSSISVIATPTLNLAGNNVICAGASVSQTVSGASTYSWNTGATSNTVVLSPVQNTAYTVTGTSAGGCSSSITNTITVNPLPTITSTLTNPILCIGETGTITVSGVGTCTWNTGASGLTLVNNPSVTTTYTLTGTDANGCINSANITQVVNQCTGLQNSAKEEGTVQAFPNPGTGIYTIHRGNTENVNYQVFAANGTLVLSGLLNGDTTTIDLGNSAPGLYYIVVKGSTGNKVAKLIKQ